jgi:outer membrane protein assembly factor BamE (lipoprotein component of BamABCDE complex)
MKKTLRSAVIAFSLALCSITPAEDVINYAPHTPPPDYEFRMAILQHKVMMGMTRDQCRQAWGNPSSIDRTVTEHGTREIWWYQSGSSIRGVLYFDNGILTTIQN